MNGRNSGNQIEVIMGHRTHRLCWLSYRCYFVRTTSTQRLKRRRVFLFYQSCYWLLARALTGIEDIPEATGQVNKDILHAVVEYNNEPPPACADLEQGDANFEKRIS
jgi:hypothetical protein